MIDWNAVNTLLQVLHGAATAGPKYNPVIAMAEVDLASLLYPIKATEPLLSPPPPPAEDPADSAPTPEDLVHGS